MKLQIIKSPKKYQIIKGKICLTYKNTVIIFDAQDAFDISFKLKAMALDILGEKWIKEDNKDESM
jgi:hypothetical protein